jgi:SpoVK/Ycf46/Vps4 family AAA+-type ATPase
VSGLPPELIRRGRFNEMFFIDLPDDTERAAIWSVHISKRGRSVSSFDMASLVSHSSGYVGAEIEAALEGAMFTAFSESSREVTTGDILAELGKSIPLSRTMSEKIDWLRKWSVGRARSASSSTTNTPVTTIDMSRFTGMSS